MKFCISIKIAEYRTSFPVGPLEIEETRTGFKRGDLVTEFYKFQGFKLRYNFQYCELLFRFRCIRLLFS